MSRSLALLLLMTALVLCGSVASGQAERRGPLPLRVFRLPDARSTRASDLADLAVIDEFRRRFPEIQLLGDTGVSIEGMELDSKPLMAIAGGVSPDVIYVNFRMSDTFISQGFLYPLDEFIQGIPGEPLAQRVPAPVVPVIHRPGEGGREHWWAMPYSMWVRGLYYRKDLFQEVGLDPNRPPQDWKEFEECARRLSRPDKGISAILLNSGYAISIDWMGLLWSAGGEVVTQDDQGAWRAAFDSPEGVDATLFFVELHTRKWRDISGQLRRGYGCAETDPERKWADGKVGMYIYYLQENMIAGDVNPDLVGVAPVPRGPTGRRGNEINCAMLGIFSGIQPRAGYTAQEIRRAAWEYIWFYGGEEAARIRTRTLVERGLGRLVNPLLLKKFGYDEYLALSPPTWAAALEEAIRSGRPEPYGHNCQMIYQAMQYPLRQCIDLELAGELGQDDAARRAKVGEILKQSAQRLNEEMLGVLPPEERQKRNHVALAVAIALFSAFLLLLYRVWRIFTPEEARTRGGWQFRRYLWAYIILLPAALSVLVWMYVPMGMGTVMAFQDYRVIGHSAFVGLQNLADVLWDPSWWHSLWVTFEYMALMLGLGFLPPIFLAILLTEVSHGKVLYRTLYYLPAVLTGMVVIYLWKLIFDPTDVGLLNILLAAAGFAPHGWLTDQRLALLCCVIPTIWAGMGPGCLIYLAALKSVPDDLYEAADMDGCGFWGKIYHITLPTLKPLIIIQFIGAFIAASESTGFILVMTFGGPGETTRVAGLHIFQKAYLFLRFGSAVTMAWLLGVIMLSFTVLQLRRLSRMEFRAADSGRGQSS